MHVGRELHHFVPAGLDTRSAKLVLHKMAGWSLLLDILLFLVEEGDFLFLVRCQLFFSNVSIFDKLVCLRIIL